MGIELNLYAKSNFRFAQKEKTDVKYNTKVALWHLPYNANYLKYDTDNDRWYEAINKNGVNEIKQAESGLTMSFNKYKVFTKTTNYSDNTQDIESQYPNGTKVIEKDGINHIFVNIKDKFNNLVAEKIFNYETNEGRKVIYQHVKQGDNTFTIVKVFSYDTDKNRKTDVVNYGYTGDFSTLTKGCEFEWEYYLLNGKEVKAQNNGDFEYMVKDVNGKELKFKLNK